MNAVIRNGIIVITRPNKLEKYIVDNLNAAIVSLKDHMLVKDDPVKFILKTALGLDQPHYPEWQPHAKYARENLADTDTALKFLTEHYREFKEVVEHMEDNFGKELYEQIFAKGFDLVRLTSMVYNEVIDQIAHALELYDEL